MTSLPRLGDHFESRQEPGREGLPTLSVTMNDGLVHRDDLDRRTETTLLPHQHLLVRTGDIAYNMMRMWQGACGLADTDGLVSPAYVVLAPKPTIDSRFAYHWFKSDRMAYLLWAYSHGLTSDRLRLYFDDFGDIPIAPPSLEVQQRIVAVIEAWDLAIAQVKSLISAKRRQLSGLLADLVLTRRRSVGRVDLTEIALKDLGHLVRGVTYDPDDDIRPVAARDTVAILTAGAIRAGQISVTGLETNVTADRVTARQRVCKGDFVLSMSNGSKSLVGKAGLAYRDLDAPAAPGAFCAIFRPRDEASRLLASMLFMSDGYREQLHIALAGSSINNLTNGELEAFRFFVAANLGETQPEFFSVMSAELAALGDLLDALQRQKRGVLELLLVGGAPSAAPPPNKVPKDASA